MLHALAKCCNNDVKKYESLKKICLLSVRPIQSKIIQIMKQYLCEPVAWTKLELITKALAA